MADTKLRHANSLGVRKRNVRGMPCDSLMALSAAGNAAASSRPGLFDFCHERRRRVCVILLGSI
jgi:hypothetical protein